MKILMISPVNPFPANSGGLVRILQVFQGLRRFHDVTLVFPKYVDGYESLQNNIEDDIIPITCKPLSRFHRITAAFSRWPYHVKSYNSNELHESVKNLLKDKEFSLIYCHFIYTLPYVMGTTLPIVLDQHNVDREYWQRKVDYYWSSSCLEKSLFARINLKKTIRFENAWLDRVQGIVSVSNRDSEYTKTFIHNPGIRFIVAPNGVDKYHYISERNPAEIKADSLTLGFFGSMDLELNQDAAIILCKEILPRVQRRLTNMNVSVLIIGRNPPQDLIDFAEKNPSQKITVTGTVDDVLPYLKKLDILVLPLQSGAGTKLRVLEAMAAGICIVGSEFAFQGIDGLVPGKQAHKAYEIYEFVEVICYLTNNPEIRRIIATRAKELAINRYSWESILQSLSDDLIDLFSSIFPYSI